MSGVRNNNNMVEKFNNGGGGGPVYREPWQKHSRNISAISAVSDISASNAEPLKGRKIRQSSCTEIFWSELITKFAHIFRAVSNPQNQDP